MASLKEKIVALFSQERESLENLKYQIRNKDVIIVLGNTRSGKSTLVNYIMGTELVAFNSRKEYKLKKKYENSAGPKIEHESLSCTTVSGIYRKYDSVTEHIIDSPGFEDNRGEEQDLVNVYCINQLMLAATVKFVVVFDIADLIHDNIRNFIKSLQYIQTLISNFAELKNSFCFIFTKDEKEYTQGEIAELLKTKIINVDCLNFNKTLVKHIATNENLIGLFRMPKGPDRISVEVDVNIAGAILNTQRVAVARCKIIPPLSDTVYANLLEAYQEYVNVEFFETEVSRLLKAQQNYFNIDKYVYASLNSELSTTKSVLTNLKTRITSTLNCKPTSLIEVKNTLQSLFSNTLQCSLSDSFVNSFQFVLFLEDCGLLKEDICRTLIKNYANTLQSQIYRIGFLLDKIEAELADRSKSNTTAIASSVGAGVGVPLLAFPPLGALAIGVSVAFGLSVRNENIRRAEERKAQGRPHLF